MRKRKLEERLTATEDVLESTLDNFLMVKESLVDLEMARDRVGYIKLGGFNGQEFSRDFLREIASEAVTSYIKNPLTNHGVGTKANYVFGQGLTITGESPDVDRLWQTFWDHPANRISFTTIAALSLKEVDLQTEGNLFLALFTTPSTGAVKVRSIHPSEIVDIVANPDDAAEPWFYRRVWHERRMNEKGVWAGMKERQAFYPAWNYRPNTKPPTWFGIDVMWNSPVYHVKVGGTSHMQFGITEFYSALDWTQAMKEAMEDYATVRSSHARFAWQSIVKGGKEAVAAIKAKLNTTFGSSASSAETNPAPVAGSVALSAKDMAELTVMKTANAQAAPDEARMLSVLAAAGFGLSYAVLTGDADKSNLATATSLDRPTELMMSMRQMLWTTILTDICSYLVFASVGAPAGILRSTGKIVEDDWGTPTVDLGKDSDGEPIPTSILVVWPPILEHDVAATVEAIVMAATLDGKVDAGVFDLPTIISQLGNALGVENVGDIVEAMVAQAEAAPPAGNMVEEAAFVELLKEVVKHLKEGAG